MSNRIIQVRPAPLARKDMASATNHINKAILIIIASGLYREGRSACGALSLAMPRFFRRQDSTSSGRKNS